MFTVNVILLSVKFIKLITLFVHTNEFIVTG